MIKIPLVKRFHLPTHFLSLSHAKPGKNRGSKVKGKERGFCTDVKPTCGLSLNLSPKLSALWNCVVVSNWAAKLSEIKPSLIEGSLVVGEKGGEARCVPVGEGKYRGKLEMSLQCLVMVES